MQDIDKIITLTSGDLVASGAKYHEYFNLTLYGNTCRYRSFIQNQNDNPHVHIDKSET